MGCGSSTPEVNETTENNKSNINNNDNNNTQVKKRNPGLKNEKIVITEDPEQQGEKFHMPGEEEEEGNDDNEENEDNGENGENEAKDSFDDFQSKYFYNYKYYFDF